MRAIVDGGARSRLNPTLRRLLALLRMNRTWARAEGVWLHDEDGRRFLDLYAQYGVLALGHNSPSVLAAVREALDSGAPTMVQPYRAPHAEALARELTDAIPGNLCRGVFTTSGAEAVEAAIKLVRASTGRTAILAASGSFHGKTMGALALTGQRQHAERFGPTPPGVEFVEFGDVAGLEARLRCDGDRIAAFFLEPIQGERGVHLPPPGYLRRVRELCSRHGVALVLDEIQTGLGRTGRLCAFEHDGIEPDVLLLGKALGGGLFPLSACLSSIDFWDDHFALLHSSTFANNNLACRIGSTVLSTIADADFCATVRSRGERLLERLEQMAQRYPGVIVRVRGRGLMSAIELKLPDERQGTFLSFLVNQGIYSYAIAAVLAELGSVLVLPTLGKSAAIRITPPLIVSDRELDGGCDAIEHAMQALERDATRTILRAVGAFDGFPRAANAEYPDHAPMLPARAAIERRRLDYAFLVHYTRTEDVVATNPTLTGLDDAAVRKVCEFTSAFAPGVLMDAPTIRSITGETVDGLVLALPVLPDEMARRGRRVAHDINRAVDLAASLGVRIVGLGGYTAPYSRRGRSACGRGVAITTGNALTAGMAVKAALAVVAAKGLQLEDLRVAIVGARGSVGSLCAKLLARARPASLLLVGNPDRGRSALGTLADELGDARIETTTDAAALTDCALILTATTAARPVLAAAPIARGAIVCDVAQPPDTTAALRSRPDVTVIDGGRVELPDPSVRFGVGNLVGLPSGVVLSCLAETILLALARETHDFGVGDDVALADVDRVLALAERHGFHLAPPLAAKQRQSEPKRARNGAQVA